jgi:hypothetical protein
MSKFLYLTNFLLCIFSLIYCSGPRIYYENDVDWLVTEKGGEIAHGQVYIDPLPLSALHSPPVTVKVHLFLTNKTRTPLQLRKEGLVLIDGHQNSLKPDLIESLSGTKGLVVFPQTTGKYIITFFISPALNPDSTSINGFVFRWEVESNGSRAIGRAQIVEDSGFDNGSDCD